MLLHSTAGVDGEGDQGQVLLYSSATDVVEGNGGQGLKRGEVASFGCVSQW